MSKRSTSVLVAAAALWAAGCQPASTPDATDATDATLESDDTEVVATLGDRKLTLQELDAHIKDELFMQETANGDPVRLYEIRAPALERLIDKTLVLDAAAREGVSPDDYLNNAVTKASDIPDEEVAAFFEENSDQMGDQTLEQVESRIRAHLRTLRATELIAKMRHETSTTVLLEPTRIEVDATGPSRGPADAPITIVEFSDFQCPYCKRVVPTLHQIADAYPDQVRIVFRHLPLDRIHDRARAAAEAAACADKQGKFWPYHDLVFENNQALSDADLAQYAADVGMDVEAFGSCVADREFQAIVDGDSQTATALGLRGTPAFFVNGIPVRGAKPFEDFARLIDSELARQPGSPKPAG